MAKRARSEAEVCGKLERGPGERSTGGNNTTTGPYAGPGGTVDVGYSKSDIYPVNLGEKASRGPAATRVPLDQLHVPYGGAGAKDGLIPGGVAPRRDRGDISYRNPKAR